MTIDLSTLASVAVTELELKHPLTGIQTGIIIEGYTPDSSEHETIVADVAREFGTNAKSIVFEDQTGKIPLNNENQAEATKESTIRSITNIRTKDPSQPLVLDGVPFKYNEESKRQLLENPLYKWMLQDWQDHIRKRENFFGKPVTNAVPTLHKSAGETVSQTTSDLPG